MKTIKVPQLPWHGTKDLALTFPDSWQIEEANIAGADCPELKLEEIRKSVKNPVDTLPIRDAARGKKQVVIIVDDMSRATRAAKIVPYILEELKEAGIVDSQIRFMAALGMHGVMNRQDFVKKLGEDVVARYACYNHNPFANCSFVGTTATFGTRVSVNDEVLKCDFKIAVASVVPHPMAGFGGGSKIILPGVCSFDTVDQNHQRSVEAAVAALKASPGQTQKPKIGMGITEGNLVSSDSDEAMKMVGLDFMVNTIINKWGESTAVYSGEPFAVREAALKLARNHYAAPRIRNKDIAISNTFAKSTEGLLGLMPALPAVKMTGGADIVFVTNTPDGQVNHYLLGNWGTMNFAKQYQRLPLPPFINHIIVFNEYPHAGSRWLEPGEKVVYLSRWDEVIKMLEKSHGQDADVVVFPSSDIQYSV